MSTANFFITGTSPFKFCFYQIRPNRAEKAETVLTPIYKYVKLRNYFVEYKIYQKSDCVNVRIFLKKFNVFTLIRYF